MEIDAILKAIKNVETLRIRYFGGSNPGAERDLVPVSVSEGKVRAVCMSSNETKTFALVKMELVVDGVPSVLSSDYPPASPAHATIREYAACEQENWSQLGWSMKFVDSVLSLHRSFKNGKVIQTPDIELRFEPIEFDLVFDGDKVAETNHRERSRPWVLRAKGQTTKTFGDIEKAQIAFSAFANSLAPSR